MGCILGTTILVEQAPGQVGTFASQTTNRTKASVTDLEECLPWHKNHIQLYLYGVQSQIRQSMRAIMATTLD